MPKRRWQFRLYQTTLGVFLFAIYMWVIKCAIAYNRPGILLFVVPLLPIIAGFFLNGRSLEARFVRGVIGGTLFYFIVLTWSWFGELRLLLPSLESTAGLNLFVSLVFLGAVHGTVISLLLYIACKFLPRKGSGDSGPGDFGERN
jgi:hypothetical protein